MTLRRFLVEEGYLERDSAGKSYEVAGTGWSFTYNPSIGTLDLEVLIDEARVARELKKQQYMGKSSG